VTVSRWESGEVLPALSIRGPLCELFGKRLEEFFPLDHMPANSVSQTGYLSEVTGLKDSLLTPETGQDAFNEGRDDESTAKEIRQLDTEKHYLEVQMKRIEVQRKRVESTIDIANQFINVLDPGCDEVVRSLTIEELLINLPQSDEGDEQEILFPTFQRVREALEAARRGKARIKSRQRIRHASSDIIKTQQAEIPSSDNALKMPNTEASADRLQVRDALSPPLGEHGNVVIAPLPETPRESGLEEPFNNPYYQLTAVRNPQEFVGRIRPIRYLYTALANRQSVSLVGPQLIGKSSLLQCAVHPTMQARFNLDLSRHIFVYLDLREYLHKTSEDFLDTVRQSIITQSRNLAGLDLHAEGSSEDKFSRVLEQIGDQGFFPVLLLDAFDNIIRNKHFDPEFFAFLRAQATIGKVSYVTASVAPLYEVCPRAIADSPFFNIFYNYSLGPLELEEARELITQPAENAGLPFTEEETEWILKIAGRHPFFIQRVSHILFEKKLSSRDSQINEQQIEKLVYESLRSHFQNAWERLSETQRVLLQDEARQKEISHRELPELSESALFRQFVRHVTGTKVFKMAPEELERALDNFDDVRALGETNLRLMNLVSQRLKMDNSRTVAEKGMVIRSILNEAFERLRGLGVRTDSAPEWKYYNFLYYRYFKYHLKNEQIAARLQFTSIRQYYRERSKAIEALLSVLLEMEKAASIDE